jgi:hypothetical protein
VLDTVKADEQKSAKTASAPVAAVLPVPAGHDSQTSPDPSAKPKPATKDMSPPESHETAKPGDAQAPAPEGKAKPEAAPKAVPAPPAPAAAASTELKGASREDIGTLVKTMVGDLARAGMLKDPELAGHIAADVIIAAETPVQSGKPPKADDTAQVPPTVAPKAAA